MLKRDILVILALLTFCLALITIGVVLSSLLLGDRNPITHKWMILVVSSCTAVVSAAVYFFWGLPRWRDLARGLTPKEAR